MKQAEGMVQDPPDAFDAAAEWWHRGQDDSALLASPEFLDWMKNPEHAAAFEAVKLSMATLHEFAATPKILKMRRSALARLHGLSVEQWVPWRIVTRIAAALLVVAIAGGALVYQKTRTVVYATETGERRVVALSDGSRISLDSGSQVDVRYTRGARALVLRKGRARFDVAHDTTRPFTVAVDDETVVAVGTAFSVEKLNTQISVTLLQGHVLVKNLSTAALKPGCSPSTVSLIAGERMVTSNGCGHVMKSINVEAETAWEAGHLVFRGVPLGEAVEQVNRYTDHPIAVDPSVASIKISGVFNAGDVGSFVNAITGYFPVSATTDANDNITLQRHS
jgi:transmembrane sensor